MKLYLAFILSFALFGLFSRRSGVWTFLIVACSATVLTGLYLFTARAWA